MNNLKEEDSNFIIPNERHVPFFRYDRKQDDNESGFVVHYSKKYLRRQRKLNEKKRADKKA